MKKKILIVNNNLHIGGVQKALLNLLNEIKEEYNITLFLFKKEGDYANDIPKEIEVIEGNKFLQLLGTSQVGAKKIGGIYYFIRGLLVVFNQIFGNYITYSILMKTQKKIGSFDYAISYLHSPNEKSFYGGCNEFVLKRVNAREKITFIHCDFINYGGNTTHNKKIYKQFDKIIAVSKGCKENFIKAIPELSSKVYDIRNFNNYKNIIQQSKNNTVTYENKYFNIITVARLSREKGIIRCINIIKDLKEKGFKIKWHIIGDGALRKEIEESIAINKLEEVIILYGNKSNPYRYMKNADLFLLTSYHEAAPMVFDECKCIGIPIMATKTTSTKEIIEDCNAGWVCENNDVAISEKLLYILNNISDLKEKKENLKKEVFTNKDYFEKFRNILS